jgi:hypothetical protein
MEPLRSLATGKEIAKTLEGEITALTVEIDKREAEIKALLA